MTLRIVAIGDVGARPSFHVGDEAMLEAAVVEIGARLDVRWTVVSAFPEETVRRYGVESVSGFGFVALGSAAAQEMRLTQINGIVEGIVELPVDDPAGPLLDALTDADAVLIAGGGNLNSTWPAHIYERAALAQVAQRLGAPLLVSGQGIGPDLTRRDGELAAAALTGAQLVGVREEASAALALQLGVLPDRIWRTCDDAAFLPVPVDVDICADLGLRAGRFVAVTINSFTGIGAGADLVASYGMLLDNIVASTGLDVVLVPHVGSLDGFAEVEADDVSYHAAVRAAATTDRIRLAPVMSSSAVADLTRAAALVVSNRYHPIVFALCAAVPVVGITVDSYTDSKIRGAAHLLGQSSWCVSILGLESGVVAAAVEEAWSRRTEISQRLSDLIGPLEKEKARYWDAFASVLAVGSEAPAVTVPDARVLPDADVLSDPGGARGAWRIRNEDALAWSGRMSVRHNDWRRAHDALAGQLRESSEELRQERIERSAAADEVVMLTEALTVERAALIAAQHLNAEIVEKKFEFADRQAEFEERLAQAAQAADLLQQRAAILQRDSDALAALKQSKTMRWSAGPRAVYRTILRVQRVPRRNP